MTLKYTAMPMRHFGGECVNEDGANLRRVWHGVQPTTDAERRQQLATDALILDRVSSEVRDDIRKLEPHSSNEDETARRDFAPICKESCPPPLLTNQSFKSKFSRGASVKKIHDLAPGRHTAYGEWRFEPRRLACVVFLRVRGQMRGIARFPYEKNWRRRNFIEKSGNLARGSLIDWVHLQVGQVRTRSFLPGD